MSDDAKIAAKLRKLAQDLEQRKDKKGKSETLGDIDDEIPTSLKQYFPSSAEFRTCNSGDEHHYYVGLTTKNDFFELKELNESDRYTPFVFAWGEGAILENSKAEIAIIDENKSK